MLKFNKAYEVRELMRRCAKRSDLISGFFSDCPEVEEIEFSFNQEYDDNNYSDSAQLISVNGWKVDWDCEYEELDEGDETSDLPKPEKHVLVACRDLVDLVASEFGYSENHYLYRKNYSGKSDGPLKGDLSNEESEYLHSYLTGSELPAKWFYKKDAKWACYYALDHGRFDEKSEFKIFARKGNMNWAYWYAFHVLKGRLPDPVESFFILSEMADDEDKTSLKRYMTFREQFLEKTLVKN